jgi:hypothetical protein
MADLPSGASGLLVREYRGKEADQLITRIDPDVVFLIAELCGHERQSAEELGQRKTRVELLEALSAAAIALEILPQRARSGPPEALGSAAPAST